MVDYILGLMTPMVIFIMVKAFMKLYNADYWPFGYDKVSCDVCNVNTKGMIGFWIHCMISSYHRSHYVEWKQSFDNGTLAEYHKNNDNNNKENDDNE